MVHCPISLARLYTGTLRRDWTAEERHILDTDPNAQRLLHKVMANVWHPSTEQLIRWADGSTPDTDIDFHINTDRCAACLSVLPS